MSALGFAFPFVLCFAIAMSWLALSLDAQIGRGRSLCQLPLALDSLDDKRPGKQPAGIRPIWAVVGSMLLFFAAMGAVAMGQLATMMPETTIGFFQAYTWPQSAWKALMTFGPIACVVMAIPGMICLDKGINSPRR